MGHIYNMKNQFWAGLGSWAVLVKKIWEVFFTGEIPVFLGLKISNLFFAHENIKKWASKVAHNWP